MRNRGHSCFECMLCLVLAHTTNNNNATTTKTPNPHRISMFIMNTEEKKQQQRNENCTKHILNESESYLMWSCVCVWECVCASLFLNSHDSEICVSKPNSEHRTYTRANYQAQSYGETHNSRLGRIAFYSNFIFRSFGTLYIIESKTPEPVVVVRCKLFHWLFV